MTRPLTPGQRQALTALVSALELAEDRLVKAALARVRRAYQGVNLRQVLALYAQAAASPNPQGRLAQLPLLMGELDRQAVALAAVLSELSELVGQAVNLGTKATGDACRVQAPSLTFDITPERELAYVADSQARFARYWGNETPRFRREVEAALEAGLQRGQGPRQIGRELARRLGGSRERADLIAADQISSARAAAMQQAQHDLGVRRYDWSATGGKRGDGRTRLLHRRLHGTRHAWGKPGPAESGGHPGQPVRCRCVALPVVEDLLD